MTDRQHLIPKFPHIFGCVINGHREAWLDARVPNPYAVKSEVWGCTRCGLAAPYPKTIREAP